MLVTMKPILEAAREGHYCVPAPNYGNAIELKMCIEAAEEMNAPLILDIGHRGNYKEFSDLCAASVKMAKEAKVPVAINLDHGSAFEFIVQAMYGGCSSVMVDRSWMSYEDNVKEVSEIVRIAHAIGLSVEAELGHVGVNPTEEELANGTKAAENTDITKGVTRHAYITEEDKRATFTKVEDAVRYVKDTGVDCLAVAVGTVHGLYPKGIEPSIDYDLLAELREAVPVPLVLHGGSGTGAERLAKASQIGACKLNVGSDLQRAGREAVAAAVEAGKTPTEITKAHYEGYKAELMRYMDFCGAKGKAE